MATQSQRPQPGFKFRPATINDARIDMLCNPCSYRCFLKKFLSPTLRNARAKGWWIFWTLILPQAMNYLVFPESLTHLLSVVVLLTLSVVNLGFHNLSYYHIVCFVILLFWLAGVIVHIIVAIVCRKRMCCRYQQVRYQQLQLAPLQEQNTTHSGTSHSTSRKLDNHFHIGYLMFVELCAYSLLIFSLIGAIASKLNGLKSGADLVALGFFVVSCVGYVFCVYIPHLVLVAVTIWVTQRFYRFLPTMNKRKTWMFLLHFLLYMCGQVGIQIMVLITIGFRFWHDNKPLDIPQDTSIYPPSERPPQQGLQISGYLICMIVAGWLVHILGVLVFFLTNNFTMQKLPIALCMNALTVFKMPQFVEDMLQPVNSDSGQQVDMVTGYMNYETMTELFDRLCKIPDIEQLASPFANPITATACVLYTGLLCAMTTCATVYTKDSVMQVIVSESVEWKVLYTLLVTAVSIGNLHSLLIGGLWVLIICGSLAALKIGIWVIFFKARGVGRTNSAGSQW